MLTSLGEKSQIKQKAPHSDGFRHLPPFRVTASTALYGELIAVEVFLCHAPKGFRQCKCILSALNKNWQKQMEIVLINVRQYQAILG